MALNRAIRAGAWNSSAISCQKGAVAIIPIGSPVVSSHFSSKPSLTGHFGGVHGNKAGAATMQWRNKPLFRRQGDIKFKTGKEAAQLLTAEAVRLDPNQELFLQTFNSCINAVAPVFDRNPKVRQLVFIPPQQMASFVLFYLHLLLTYSFSLALLFSFHLAPWRFNLLFLSQYAWIAKQLTEPERTLQFRVSWLDDAGTLRLNRGFRVQYSSALGPYDGGLHFGPHVTDDFVKAAAFDGIFKNSLAGLHLGAAAGGSDFDPSNKSEAEIQRFCQSFMTELSKYIGVDVDLPSTGVGVGAAEIGYLYGQYKRQHMHASHKGRGLLWAGHLPWVMAEGYAVAHFAERMLRHNGDSLQGKKVLITGSDSVALFAADRVLQFGGVPLTMSDDSGYVLEDDGIDAAKLTVLKKIKAERGAKIGRYVVSSTTAKFNGPGESIFKVPCDVCIPCASSPNEIDKEEAILLAESGCKYVVEGGFMSSTPAAVASFKKSGIQHGTYKATLCASTVAQGWVLTQNPIYSLPELDAAIEERTEHVFTKVKATAKEYNTRGNILAGTHITAFTKVADAMMEHGAV